MLPIITGRRASQYLATCALTSVVLCSMACDKTPLLAPNLSTITLTANSSIVSSNGTAQINATVIEGAGTPVQNGTNVTFSTNLGTISPVEAKTTNGVATAQFVANGQSGIAEIRATSGSAKPADTANPTLKLTVGGAAATRVLVTASPSRISQGGSSTIAAVVTDTNGNIVTGVPVAFTTDSGTLSASVVSTSSAGQAVTLLSATKDATVTATIASGSGTTAVTGTAKVTVGSTPDISISLSTTSPVQGQAVTFTITVTAGTATDSFQSLVVNFGDGQTTSSLGNSSTTVSHTYSSSGSYTVTATGSTAAGDTKSNAAVVTIAPRGVLNVTIAKDQTTVTNNVPVTFTATVSPSTNILSYSWDFGDGVGCTPCSSQLSHTYAVGQVGKTETVTLTVKTTDGNSGVGQIQFVVN